MIDLMPKISEKFEQNNGLEKYIEKYGKAEIQFFPREELPHYIDFSVAVDKLCSEFKMKEITIHPPLNNYDIEIIILYNFDILLSQLKQCVEFSEKYKIKVNLIYHTHWPIQYHRACTIDKIKEALKIIEGKNVNFLIENLFMITEQKNEFSAFTLVQEIDHPNCKGLFDICHAYCQANMYNCSIEEWLNNKLSKEFCEKYLYQVHFSYTGNNDGYKDKKTHGIGHPTEELLLKDWKILEEYRIANKQIVTEIAEVDYSYRKDQIQDIEWLEKI